MDVWSGERARSRPTVGDAFKFITALTIDTSTRVLFFCKLSKFLVMLNDNKRKILSLAEHKEVLRRLIPASLATS